MDAKQKKQEDEYAFPYHYVPSWNNGRFGQVRVMRWGYEYSSYMEFVTDLIGKYSPKSMIDVGCGDGRLLYEVGKKFPEIEKTGVDYSSQAVSFAKSFNPETKLFVGDITDPSFSLGKFDLIALVETLEHIPLDTIGGFVEGLSGLLETGGKLIVTVPCSNIPVSKKHYQHFSLESLEKTLSPHFKLEEHYHTNTKSTLTYIISRILTNRLYSLNTNKLTTFLYQYYKKHLFVSDKDRAGRVIGVFSKIK